MGPNRVKVLAITMVLIAATFGLDSTETKDLRSSRMDRSTHLLQHPTHSAAFSLEIGTTPRRTGWGGPYDVHAKGTVELRGHLRETPREWECKNHRSVT